MEPDIIELIDKCRERSKNLEENIRALLNSCCFSQTQDFASQHREMEENIMLAVRHQEDVRMRLGKVRQWAEDGVSCYDKREDRNEQSGE